MFTFLIVLQILVSLSMITLIMLQQGKGADMGAAFGSGSSGTVFGARGSGSFFTRATGVLAAVFFINCLLIASPMIRYSGSSDDSLAEQIEQQAVQQQADEQAEAIVEKLEQAQDESQQQADEAIQVETASDLPDVPVEPVAEPGADDLPE